MDYSEILQLIGSVGFPAVFCFLLFKQNVETMEDVKESLNQNTLTIQKLIDKMETWEK